MNRSKKAALNLFSQLLVKLVTAAKGKSKKVKKILENVNARKRFYKNRPREKSFVYMYK